MRRAGQPSEARQGSGEGGLREGAEGRDSFWRAVDGMDSTTWRMLDENLKAGWGGPEEGRAEGGQGGGKRRGWGSREEDEVEAEEQLERFGKMLRRSTEAVSRGARERGDARRVKELQDVSLLMMI